MQPEKICLQNGHLSAIIFFHMADGVSQAYRLYFGVDPNYDPDYDPDPIQISQVCMKL